MQTGLLEITNISDRTWYVCVSCERKLTLENKVFYELDWGDAAYDEFGKKKEVFFPINRLDPDSTSHFAGFGKPNMPKVYCLDDSIRLFFIEEEHMKNLTWKEICAQQKFKYKIKLSNQELDNLDWKYVFNVK